MIYLRNSLYIEKRSQLEMSNQIPVLRRGINQRSLQRNGMTQFAPVPGRPVSTVFSPYLNLASPSSSNELKRSKTTVGQVKDNQIAVPGRPLNMQPKYDDDNYCYESNHSDLESASPYFEKKHYKPPPLGTPRDLNPIPSPPRSRPTSHQRSSPPMSFQHTYARDDMIEQSADGFQLKVDDMSASQPEHLDSIDAIESNIKYKTGWLQKLEKSNNNKDFIVTKYWCSINQGSFSAAVEKNKIPTHNLPTSGILTVKKLNNVHHNNMTLHCFNIVDAIPKRDQSRVHTFGASNEMERNDWISMIWRCLTPSEDVARSLITAVDKAGRFEYKKTVAGIWQSAWLGLLERNLHLWLDYGKKHIHVDLRKVKTLSHLTEDSAIHLNYRGRSIYLRSPASSSETKDTFDMITRARNTIGTGSEIDDQFLTKRDVPVIVDLCLNHIFLNGLKTRNIYAQNVNHSKVETLMKALQRDPYNVKISAHEYTVHDVANSLKMFFSTCAEPLLTTKFAKGWKGAYDAREKKNKVTRLQPIISWLKSSDFQTLRLLLLHLKSVSKCQGYNSMSEYRLAEVFGPILIGESSECYRGLDIAEVGKNIFLCMLENFDELFKISETDLEHEALNLEKVLCKDSAMEKVQLSDDGVIVTVAIDHRTYNEMHFKVLPKMTAKDVCEQLMVKLDRLVRIDKVILCEMVCNDQLVRPIHFSELVFEVLLRWGMWDKKGSATNCLLFKNDDIYKKILPYVPASDPILLTAKVRLAKPKAKSTFKKVILKFEKNQAHDVMGSVGQLTYFTTSEEFKVLNSWNINDLAWYMGSERRNRVNNPTRFALTFTERIAAVRRTKQRPYFGTTVCLKSEEDLLKWMAVMLAGEYPVGILPLLYQY